MLEKLGNVVLVAAYAIVMLLGSSVVSAYAADSKTTTVRVGFFESNGMMNGGGDANDKSGYCYDYMMRIAANNGWRYDFHYGSFAELYEKLKNGEIDILPYTNYSEQRSHEVLFSGKSLVEEEYFIAVKTNLQSTVENALKSLNGAVISTVNGWDHNNLLLDFIARNNLNAKLVYFPEVDECWRALRQNQVDATVYTSITYSNEWQCIVNFGKKPTYIAVNRRRPDLLQELDRAMSAVAQESPAIRGSLYEKYFPNNPSIINLTTEEQTWLAKHPVIRVGGFRDDAPYVYSLDDENHNATGLTVELIKGIIERMNLGLGVEFHSFDSLEEMEKALDDGVIDVFAPFYPDYNLAQKHNLIFSNTMRVSNMALVYKAGMTVKQALQKIAATATKLGVFYVRKNFPNSQIVNAVSIGDAVQKVLDNEANCVIAQNVELYHAVEKYDGLNRAILPEGCETCFTTRPWNYPLIRLLNRGLRYFTETEISAIASKYSYVDIDMFVKFILIIEFTTCFFLIISMIGLFLDKDSSESIKWLKCFAILNLLWLIADILTYLSRMAWFGDAFTYAVTYLAFILGSFVLIGMIGFSCAYIRECGKLDRWVFRIPLLLLIAGVILISVDFFAGKILLIENGAPKIIGDIPLTVSVLHIFILAFYMPLIAFLNRKSIGGKSILFFLVYGIFPLVSIIITLQTGQDYSVVVCALATVVIIYQLHRILVEKRLNGINNALVRYSRHEKLKADAFNFMQNHENPESFIDFFAHRVFDLYGCDHVLYCDISGHNILKERPNAPKMDFSQCSECPHHDFNHPLYSDGFTVMNDCRIGCKGIPVHPKCHVRSALTYVLYEDDKAYGYIAIHYVDRLHEFSKEEQNTFDSIAKFMSIMITRAKHRLEAQRHQRLLHQQRESRQFQMFSDLINAGSWRITLNADDSKDKDFDIFWSDELRHILGFENQNDFPNTFDAILKQLHEDDKASVIHYFKKLMFGHLEGSIFDICLRAWRKNGEMHWYHAYGRLDKDSANVRKVYGIIVDISAEKKVEEQQQQLKTALAESEQSHRRLISLQKIVKAASWTLYLNEKREIVNVEFMPELITVLHNKFRDNADWMAAIHPEDRQRTIDESTLAMQDRTGSTLFDIEYRLRSKTGEYHWIRSAGMTVNNADGSGEMYGISIDIDDTVKHREEEKRRLEEALNMAQSANRAKTMFLNNMSHDIRTPMNAIIGYAGLAASHIDSKALVSDYLMKIGQSSDHLLSLINDVLDMARIESGKMNLHEAKESLPEIIYTLRNMLQSQVRDKRLELFVDCGDIKDENIICDKLRLSQVFLNILSNSVKYTPAGGEISCKITETGRTVSTSAKAPNRARYIFVFKDNGIGMSEEFLKEIFDPFSRAKNTTTSGVQGTGLGMAITRNIVDMMGGEIKIRSELGKGTEVTVAFDFTISEDAATPIAPAAEQAESANANDTEKADKNEKADQNETGDEKCAIHRILLVEDNEINREIAEVMLTEAGFEIDTAENGKIAVEKIENTRDASAPAYDLILMDIQMPVMNGYDATKAIRRWEAENRRERTPIVAMTANAFAEDRESAFEAGMDEHLSKPVKSKDLLKTIRRFGTKRD